MMWCPVCGAEHQPQATRCADCDVDLVADRPEPADSLFRAAAAQLADELARYEQAGGRDPLEFVSRHFEWSQWFSAAASETSAPRPAGRWEVVLQRGNQRVVVVGLPGGGWQVAASARDSWSGPQGTQISQKLPNEDRDVGQEIDKAISGVPLAVWIAIVAALVGFAIWLGLRGEPAELRALAWLDVAVVALVVVCVVPASMRRLLVKVPALVLPIVGVLIIAWATIGEAEGLHVGYGWPVNAWRDLFENDSLLIDTVDDKRVEHHEHCSNSGCYEEDHYWIDVGSQEWPVDQATHDVVRQGEVVEIAYRPYTQFVEYVAYGPGLAATRDENELRVSVTLAPIERQVFEQQILPGFTERTGRKVTIVQMQPDTLIDVLENEGGSAFDLLAVDNDQIGQLAHQDLVQDMSEAVSLIPGETLPAMRSLSQFEDRTLFLPFRPNVMITYYDQAQFQRLGVAPPQAWDQLLDVAARLKENGEHLELHGASGAPSATQLYEFLLQAGGDPFALDSPQSMQALKFLEQLAPALDGDTEKAKFDTVNDDLVGGETALAPNWTFGVREVVVEAGKRDVAVHPGWAGPAGPAHVLGGDVLAIPRGSERRKPALELAEYLLSQPVQATLANELFWPSMRTDAYQSVQPELRPYWDAITEAMTNAAPRPAVACWHDVEKVLSKAWNAIVVQRESPGELAQHWAAEVRDVCERQQATVPVPGPPAESPLEDDPYVRPDFQPFGAPSPDYITAGPDGNLWFTGYGFDEDGDPTDGFIGRITPGGEVARFEDPNGGISQPDVITAGPDGNLWFTSLENNSIGRITPAGEITTFEDTRIRAPEGIAAGPDANVWFTSYENDRIGRITPSGEITLLTPDGEIGGPDNIIAGADGNLWFAAYDDDSIGRITPNGEVTTFDDPDGKIKELEDITAGPDGNVWFTGHDYDENDEPTDGYIGRITASGDITIFDAPNEIAGPEDITAGPDGNLWFTSYDEDRIGRVTSSGEITVVRDRKIAGPEDITAGPDGNLWFTNFDDQTVGRMTPSGEITTYPVR
jgi:trehalose transport system substrate-binding protein